MKNQTDVKNEQPGPPLRHIRGLGLLESAIVENPVDLDQLEAATLSAAGIEVEDFKLGVEGGPMSEAGSKLARLAMTYSIPPSEKDDALMLLMAGNEVERVTAFIIETTNTYRRDYASFTSSWERNAAGAWPSTQEIDEKARSSFLDQRSLMALIELQDKGERFEAVHDFVDVLHKPELGEQAIKAAAATAVEQALIDNFELIAPSVLDDFLYNFAAYVSIASQTNIFNSEGMEEKVTKLIRRTSTAEVVHAVQIYENMTASRKGWKPGDGADAREALITSYADASKDAIFAHPVLNQLLSSPELTGTIAGYKEISRKANDIIRIKTATDLSYEQAETLVHHGVDPGFLDYDQTARQRGLGLLRVFKDAPENVRELVQRTLEMGDEYWIQDRGTKLDVIIALFDKLPGVEAVSDNTLNSLLDKVQGVTIIRLLDIISELSPEEQRFSTKLLTAFGDAEQRFFAVHIHELFKQENMHEFKFIQEIFEPMLDAVESGIDVSSLAASLTVEGIIQLAEINTLSEAGAEELELIKETVDTLVGGLLDNGVDKATAHLIGAQWAVHLLHQMKLVHRNVEPKQLVERFLDDIADIEPGRLSLENLFFCHRVARGQGGIHTKQFAEIVKFLIEDATGVETYSEFMQGVDAHLPV